MFKNARTTLDVTRIAGFITPAGILNKKHGTLFNEKFLEHTPLWGLEAAVEFATGQYVKITDIAKIFPRIIRWDATMGLIGRKDSHGLYVVAGPPNSYKSSVAGILAGHVFERGDTPWLFVRWNEPAEDRPTMSGYYFPLCNGMIDSINMVTAFQPQKALGARGTSKADEHIFRMISFFCHLEGLTILATYNTGTETGDITPHTDQIVGSVDGTLVLKDIRSGNVWYRSRKQSLKNDDQTETVRKLDVGNMFEVVAKDILMKTRDSVRHYDEKSFKSFVSGSDLTTQSKIEL